jgi:hypothetical protein
VLRGGRLGKFPAFHRSPHRNHQFRP